MFCPPTERTALYLSLLLTTGVDFGSAVHLLNMANHHKNENQIGRIKPPRGAEGNVKSLRKTVKREFGSDMEDILGADITKQDRTILIDNYDKIIQTIDDLQNMLMANRHFKETVAAKSRN